MPPTYRTDTRSTADERLAIADAKDDTARYKVDAGVLSDLEQSLAGKGGVYDQEADIKAKEQQTKIKAVADYHKAVNSGDAAARTRALAHLFETVYTTPERLAKLTSAANSGLLQNIAMKMSTLGDSASDSKSKSGPAWQMFYEGASAINGSALLATYNRMEEQYGPPPDSYLAAADGMDRLRGGIDQKIGEQRKLIDNSYARLRSFTDNVNTGNDAAARHDYDEIAKMIPGVGTPAFIADLQKNLAEEPDPYQGAIDKREKYLLDRIQQERGGDKPDAPKVESNFFAEWLSSEQVRDWAKFHGFDVGRTYPLTDENKKRLAEGKIANGVVTPNGIYVAGPDDARARKYGLAEIDRSPAHELFRGLGIGRPTDRTKELVEFDIMGNPNMKRHPDGAWYFTETPDGGKTYLTEADLAARRAALPDTTEMTTATAAESGPTTDGGTLIVLDDGRYAYGKDADHFAIVPPAMVEKLRKGSKLKPLGKGEDASVKIASSTAGVKDPTAMPPGVQKTTTPPQGAVETIRLVKDKWLKDPTGSIAGRDESGKRQVYLADQLVSPVRTVTGGFSRKPSLEDRVVGMANKHFFKKNEEDLDQNQEVAGDAPTKAQTKASQTQKDAIREGIPAQAYDSIAENLNTRYSSDAAVAAETQRAKVSNDTTPDTTTTLQGWQAPTGTGSTLLRPGSYAAARTLLGTRGAPLSVSGSSAPGKGPDDAYNVESTREHNSNPAIVRRARKAAGLPEDPAVSATGTQVETPTR